MSFSSIYLDVSVGRCRDERQREQEGVEIGEGEQSLSLRDLDDVGAHTDARCLGGWYAGTRVPQP